MNWTIEEIDIEQGSEPWHELRRGIATASMFKVLMTNRGDRKGRETYLYKLAGERLTGIRAEAFSNADMEHGKEVEPEIRRNYAFMRECEPRAVGFVRATRPDLEYAVCGSSPDSVIDNHGMIEIKRTAPHLLIPMLLELERGIIKPPGEHIAQCQGGMLLNKREWCDLVIGFPKMRSAIYRIERDDNYLEHLVNEIEVFDLELRRLVERLK